MHAVDHAGRQASGQTSRQTSRHGGCKQAGRQTGKQTGKQANKQTGFDQGAIAGRRRRRVHVYLKHIESGISRLDAVLILRYNESVRNAAMFRPISTLSHNCVPINLAIIEVPFLSAILVR